MKTINLFVARRKNLDNTKDKNEQKELAQSLESDKRFKEVNINLFVACPQKTSKLRKQKEFIKKKCLESNTDSANEFYNQEELNKDSAKEKSIVNIKPVTYDDPERREEVSKQIIEHRADIVVFLFDKDYDECLLDELKLAVEQSIKFHKPEPLVYIKKEKETGANDIANDNDAIDNDDPNKEIDKFKKVREVLAEGGWRYDPFEDTDDLWNKVKDKIDRYAHSYNSIREIQKLNKKKYYGFRIGLPFLSLCVILSVVFGIIFYRNWKNAESKKLLIFGGGSARNYIEDIYLNLNQDSIPEDTVKLIKVNPQLWWYAPMPSADAYRMIAENILNLDDDYKKSLYYPIIISAEKANTDTYFKRSLTESKFREKGVVIGVSLGNDTLVVYGSDSFFDSDINASILDSFVLNPFIDNISIMKTSDNSGTFKAYYNDSTCPNLKNLVDKPDLIFSDNSVIEKDKWIALGSKHYWPANGKLNPRFVYIDKEGQKEYLSKSIYLYFVLYKDKNSDNYVLPTATLEFLDRIHVSDSIVDGNNNHLIIKNKKDKQINPDIVSSIIVEKTTILFDKFYIEKKKIHE